MAIVSEGNEEYSLHLGSQHKRGVGPGLGGMAAPRESRCGGHRKGDCEAARARGRHAEGEEQFHPCPGWALRPASHISAHTHRCGSSLPKATRLSLALSRFPGGT